MLWNISKSVGLLLLFYGHACDTSPHVDEWAGDTFEAVVPFMGESITDGTLATFLKSTHLISLCFDIAYS